MRILAQLVGGIVITSLFAYGCVMFANAINKLWEKKNVADENDGDAEHGASVSDGSATDT